MKFKLDYSYIKKIKYITFGFIILYVNYLIITNLGIVIKNISNTLSFVIKITSPFLWGLILAYLMNPIVIYFERQLNKLRINKKWERHNWDKRKMIIRGISLILTLILFILIVYLTIYSVFVMINGSFKDFKLDSTVKKLIDYGNNLNNEVKNIEKRLVDLGISADLLDFVNRYSNKLVGTLQDIVTNMAEKIATIGRYIIDISFGFVFAFNFIMRREYFSNLVENCLRLIFIRDRRRNQIKEISSEINKVFMNFIRGRIIDLTLLSFITVISLIIIKFDYAFLIGIFAGYTNIVPYLGTWIGIIPAVIIGLVNGGWREALFVGAYIVIVQQVYYTLVSPRVQGKSIGMHPVFILLSIFIFGNVFGLIGVIFAIPLGGIVRIFIVRWAKYRQESKNIKLIDGNNK
jgi:predicted PurR-regulated permease PerM